MGIVPGLASDEPSQAVKDLVKKYGKKAFTTATELEEKPKKIISFSPALDLILGGGITEGSWITISGAPKAGKTTSILHLCAKLQRPENGGRNIYYINAEGRIKPRDTKGIEGLNKNKFTVIGSYVDDDDEDKVTSKIFDAEEFLSIAEDLIHNEPGCVVVIDSLSALCAAKEKVAEIGQQQRAPVAVLVSQFCKHVGSVIGINNCIIISVNHIIANTSGYGKAKIESGGNKQRYAADIILEIKNFEYWKIGGKDAPETEAPIGQIPTWEVHCSALGPPGRKIQSYIRYGVGIDEAYEIMQLGLDMGFIDKSGAWYRCSFMKDHLDILGVEAWDKDAEKMCQVQGMDKLHKLLQAKSEWFDILNREVKMMLLGEVKTEI